jgi:hypothetical protein
MEECDVFINCKHDGFEQVKLLYQAAALKIPCIINIGSNGSDGIKTYEHLYAVEKAALDKANEQLFYNGVNTTVLRFGWIDTPRVSQVTESKMSVEYCGDVIDWVLAQPHRVKELTITPNDKSI